LRADSTYREIETLLESQATIMSAQRIALWESGKLIALKIAFWNKKSRPTASNIADIIAKVYENIDDIVTEIQINELFDLYIIENLKKSINEDDVGENDIKDIGESFDTINKTIKDIQNIERKLIIEKQKLEDLKITLKAHPQENVEAIGFKKEQVEILTTKFNILYEAYKSTKKDIKKVPEYFSCPITIDTIMCAVSRTDNEGHIHTFEKYAIEKWLANNNSEPTTQAKVSIDMYKPNPIFNSLIDEFIINPDAYYNKYRDKDFQTIYSEALQESMNAGKRRPKQTKKKTKTYKSNKTNKQTNKQKKKRKKNINLNTLKNKEQKTKIKIYIK